MTRAPRLLLAGLATLVLAATGCIITSAQIFTHYDLPDPFTIDSSTDPFERVLVDLNTVSEYNDHKEDIKGLTDVAFGGRFENLAGPAGTVEIWMTRDNTNYGSISQVKANGIMLWGPVSIGAAGTTDAVHQLTWDESSKLFDAAGRQALIGESRDAA
ncbi:MAG: hypothetical protein ACHQ52_10030 [Candidatus Eisenbacteria bacterium]